MFMQVFLALNLCDLHCAFWAWILILLHVSHTLIWMCHIIQNIFVLCCMCVDNNEPLLGST
jgi:hypothetical protein